ncbi:hypothetical protein NKI66_03895 [Mesorhizobium sp. M0518]|uniref:hypothetical protein n=1 Tax=unclassified Mesorhizobium TaxID=325217 RepID=UPI00333CC7B3
MTEAAAVTAFGDGYLYEFRVGSYSAATLPCVRLSSVLPELAGIYRLSCENSPSAQRGPGFTSGVLVFTNELQWNVTAFRRLVMEFRNQGNEP